VADQHPEIFAELTELLELAREDIGDYDRTGTNMHYFEPNPQR